jgi:hypothetical protein
MFFSDSHSRVDLGWVRKAAPRQADAIHASALMPPNNRKFPIDIPSEE